MSPIFSESWGVGQSPAKSHVNTSVVGLRFGARLGVVRSHYLLVDQNGKAQDSRRNRADKVTFPDQARRIQIARRKVITNLVADTHVTSRLL